MLFNDLSHVVITFNSLDDGKRSGNWAMAKLCFGSDENAISQILYSDKNGSPTPVWTLPFRTRVEGTISKFNIFTGIVGEQILVAVGKAADRLKKAGIVGRFAGRTFRVSKTGVEEVKAEADHA